MNFVLHKTGWGWGIPFEFLYDVVIGQINSTLFYPINFFWLNRKRLFYLFVFYAFPLWKETKLSQQYEIANIWIKSDLKITIGFPEYLNNIWYKSYRIYTYHLLKSLSGY